MCWRGCCLPRGNRKLLEITLKRGENEKRICYKDGMTKQRGKNSMRKILIAGCSIIIVGGCSPSAPTAFTPTNVPTLVPTAIVENPPACWGADLIYHPQLQQVLL